MFVLCWCTHRTRHKGSQCVIQWSPSPVSLSFKSCRRHGRDLDALDVGDVC